MISTNQNSGLVNTPLAAEFLVWRDTTFPPVNLYNAPKVDFKKSSQQDLAINTI